MSYPAAFGRLCVETDQVSAESLMEVPAAFGRLCVETENSVYIMNERGASRLRAAVC